VTVQTRASRVHVMEVSSSEYKVWVHAAPEKNRANRAVCDALARFFNVPRRCVHIVAGATARRKMVSIGCDDA